MSIAKLTTRGASSADAAAACAIYNAAIAERQSTFEIEPRRVAEFAERIGVGRYPLLVAEVNGEAVGWAGLSPYSDRSCYAGIAECSVYVAAAARGRGAGTALAEDLAAEAAHRGLHKLLGKVFADNLASIRLCERCDFSTVGVHRRHGKLEGRWRDVLLVERLLAPADGNRSLRGPTRA